MKILKKEKLKSKSDFAAIFKKAQGRHGGFRGIVLSLIPNSEVLAIEVPVVNGQAIWSNIHLPYAAARDKKLKILTHRAQFKGKPALLVGIQKRTK
jgi:RNase P protein component